MDSPSSSATWVSGVVVTESTSAVSSSPHTDYVLEVVGPVVLLAHVRGDASEAVKMLVDGLARAGAEHPEGTGLLLILHRGAVPPDEPTRQLFVDAVRNPVVRGVSVVVLGDGFWAAAVRSVMTFFAVTSRLPVRLFASPEPASAWLQARLRDAEAHQLDAIPQTARRLASREHIS